jgi:hypothetical protein
MIATPDAMRRGLNAWCRGPTMLQLQKQLDPLLYLDTQEGIRGKVISVGGSELYCALATMRAHPLRSMVRCIYLCIYGASIISQYCIGTTLALFRAFECICGVFSKL